MTIQQILTEHIDVWTAADTAKKSGRGRSSGNAASVYGIKKLRELILELAVRGKLVPQDANDEPASELLKRIEAEKAKLIAEGKIKSKSPLTPLLQRGGSTTTSSTPVISNAPPFVKGGLGGIFEEEHPFELPQGWEWTLLGEITNFGTTEKLDLISDDTWVLDLEDIEKDTSKLLQKFRFSERRSLSTKNSFLAGDVLYGKLRPYLNKVIVADEDGVCTTEILPFRCYGPFSNNYFKFALKSPYFISYVNARSYGMKMPRLGTEDGRKAYFPLPPLAEQQRIVAKVDELMALCDQLENQHSNAAEAHEKLVSYLLGTLTQSPKTGSPLCKRGAGGDFDWQRIAAHFDTLFTTETSIDPLKQTLLQLAVMGKLVPQDPNDEPASELLKRIQAEKAKLIAEGKIKKSKQLAEITDDEKPFDLPWGWEWIRISDISELITSGSRGWAQYLSDEGAKFITMGNLSRGNYELRLGNMRYVNPPKSGEGSRTKLETDDLLISITGDVGNLGRIPENFGDAYINQHTCLLRFVPQCRNRYFPEVLRSPMAVLQFNEPQRGIKNSFRLGDLDEMVIPLPPRNEQHRIVAKVDELMAICDQLKSRLTEANQLQQKMADVLVEQATA
jgi:type I restriction enzyme S subunit